jgi:hypothetical protein
VSAGPWPKVNIVINNFNYAEFLPDSIESALSQTYPSCSVTVVDDGSTDESSEVLARFADRAVVVHAVHGGQASALNEGWNRCHGTYVLFLDADDTLRADVVSRAVAAFAQNGRASKVQFPLEYVDAKGGSLGRQVPKRGVAIPNGNLRDAVLRHGDDIAWSPMSGNVFSSEFLRSVMPIPVSDYREIGADLYLNNLAPLYGAIVSLAEPGGAYRIHARNSHFAPDLDIARTSRLIALTRTTHRHMRRHATSLGLRLPAGGIGSESLMLIAHTLVLQRLPDGRARPSRTDAMRVALKGVRVALRRSDRPWRVRAMFIAWFLAMALAPRGIATRLANQFTKLSIGA